MAIAGGFRTEALTACVQKVTLTLKVTFWLQTARKSLHNQIYRNKTCNKIQRPNELQGEMGQVLLASFTLAIATRGLGPWTKLSIGSPPFPQGHKMRIWQSVCGGTALQPFPPPHTCSAILETFPCQLWKNMSVL